MVILSNSLAPVKQSESFDLNIVCDDNEIRMPYTLADTQWWAENNPANRDGFEIDEEGFVEVGPSDAEMDRRAEESAQMDLYCRGIGYC